MKLKILFKKKPDRNTELLEAILQELRCIRAAVTAESPPEKKPTPPESSVTKSNKKPGKRRRGGRNATALRDGRQEDYYLRKYDRD